jgi:probable HAF family extracellular repeat protein
MKSRILTLITAMTLFAALAIPVQLAAQKHIRYTVTDLGPTQSFAEGINNKGWVASTTILPEGVIQHALLWRKGIKTDLGTFGGPNSSAFNRPSERGQVAGNAETSTPDPLGEDFCLYGTHLVCLGFIWQNGVMTSLGTIGGNNSWANGGMNNRGQVVGLAENSSLDSTCATPALEAKPVIWEKGGVQELPTFPGDADGTALSINDRGQAVGVSTDCNASPTIFHAVIWQNGTVIDLGNFGGTLNNVAQGINNRGQVVGYSDLPGDTSSHAFLWRNGVMTDLGTIEGLPTSLAFGINDERQVVGMVCDASFDCGAFLWQDGVMTDLNTLLPKGSPWSLIVGTSINARGEIVGVGDTGGGYHAVLLTPCDEKHANDEGCRDEGTAVAQGEANLRPRVALSEGARESLRQRMGLRYRILDSSPAKSDTASDSDAAQDSSCTPEREADYVKGAEMPLTYHVSGECAVNFYPKDTLTGGCIGLDPFSGYCIGKTDLKNCPPAAQARNPQYLRCRQGGLVRVDHSRSCVAH